LAPRTNKLANFRRASTPTAYGFASEVAPKPRALLEVNFAIHAAAFAKPQAADFGQHLPDRESDTGLARLNDAFSWVCQFFRRRGELTSS
jgi:hypothetical protein